MSRTDFKPFLAPGPTDAGDWLKASLAAWPDVPEAIADLLERLPWRVRAALILRFAYKLPLPEAARRLNISKRTLQGDIAYAVSLVEKRLEKRR